LRVGENVIAVMIKQSSAGSSDLSFDLSLEVSLDLPTPSEPTPEPVREPLLERTAEKSAEASFEPVASEPIPEQGPQDGSVEITPDDPPSSETAGLLESQNEPTEGVLWLEARDPATGCSGCLAGDLPSEGWLLFWLLACWVLRRRAACF
jgi:hypothetical protein